MNGSEVQSELYYKYKDYGIIPLAAPCSFIMLVIALFGHFGNISIIYATVKNKSLQSSCNVLLAIASFTDTVHMITPFIYAYFTFFGRNFTSLLTCFYVQMFPLIGCIFSIQLPTAIGVDRLLCVAMPSLYRRLNQKYYISFYLLICTLYVIYKLWEIYTQIVQRASLQVICLLVEGMTKESLASMFNYQIAHNIITVLCYVGVWLCIRFKTKGSQTSQRILKSLVTITTVLILGWTINAIVQTVIISTLKLSDDAAFFIEDYFGLGPTIVCSVNYFILYYTSGDYRAVFRKQLNAIWTVGLRRKTKMFADRSTVQITMVTPVSGRSHARNSSHG
ncbi:serpentine type 7TM GPCR chemoreceptor srsx domain-containing protein [Ditylenchus destructor]|uniref:Serpentine type 7TM GPCR chemoreceptor srsx domain-containing protein n=1 Tax=Ditylenchus destructor TaxID=166010 RepID=A0AAD4QZE1_9BILA|nr:serpentine type 7TM GPCR chemoreceptor srsx domain-containing protein [Ditylenchus destructor]